MKETSRCSGARLKAFTSSVFGFSHRRIFIPRAVAIMPILGSIISQMHDMLSSLHIKCCLRSPNRKRKAFPFKTKCSCWSENQTSYLHINIISSMSFDKVIGVEICWQASCMSITYWHATVCAQAHDQEAKVTFASDTNRQCMRWRELVYVNERDKVNEIT